MKRIINLILATMLTTTLWAQQQPFELKVWENGAPQENGITAPEELFSEGRLRNISEATLGVYLPSEETATGAAVLICPGGGYGIESALYEGSEFARILNVQGVAAIVLKYRLPNGNHEIPLSDAHQAMRLIRDNAQAWHIDPTQVGVCGFSAGGHLASTLGTHYDAQTRPDFMVLFYPVVSLRKEITHQGTRQNLLGKEQNNEELIGYYSNNEQVTPDTPPTILILCDDDKTVPPVNSTLFYNALKENGVAASMYIYPEGGHGWGCRTGFGYYNQWVDALFDWMRFQHYLK